MGTLEGSAHAGSATRPRTSSRSVLGFAARFHQVGAGLFQSADGRAHLRFPSPGRVTLRVTDGDGSTLWTGLQTRSCVFLRRPDGELFEGVVRWLPGGERFVWQRTRRLRVPPVRGDASVCRLRFSPRTHEFQALDERLCGRLNPENGRIDEGRAAGQAFDGLAGNGLVAMCLADGRAAVLATGREEQGDYLVFDAEPLLDGRVPA